MSKHTPGPWKVGGDGLWIQPPVASDNVICDLVSRDADSMTEEDEANAHLIAAAPDLLAALKKAHNCATFDEQSGTCDGCFVSEAIAEAEGKE